MNYKLLVIVFCLLLITSCNNKKNEVVEKTKLYKTFSSNLIGINEYEKIYTQAKDSMNLWVDNNLKNYLQLTSKTWKLDSLLCFNNDKNKCVTSILVQEGKDVSNAIDFFYGVKIKKQWYFFTGATIYTFSEMYGQKERTPLSFSKLHEIAMQEVFSDYLIKNSKGEWEINDKFFNEMNRIINNSREADSLYRGIHYKTDEEYWDKWAKTLVELNWSTRDTTNKKQK